MGSVLALLALALLAGYEFPQGWGFWTQLN